MSEPERQSRKNQTVIHCSPHDMVDEEHKSKVFRNITCQTVISTNPNSGDEDIYVQLEYMPFSELAMQSIKEVDLPRRGLLSWGNKAYVRLDDQKPAINENSILITPINSETNNRQESLNSEDLRTVQNEHPPDFNQKRLSDLRQLSDYSISSFHGYYFGQKEDKDKRANEFVQTNIGVSPMVFRNENDIAVVTTENSTQSDIACNRNESNSRLIETLKREKNVMVEKKPSTEVFENNEHKLMLIEEEEPFKASDSDEITITSEEIVSILKKPFINTEENQEAFVKLVVHVDTGESNKFARKDTGIVVSGNLNFVPLLLDSPTNSLDIHITGLLYSLANESDDIFAINSDDDETESKGKKISVIGIFYPSQQDVKNKAFLITAFLYSPQIKPSRANATNSKDLVSIQKCVLNINGLIYGLPLNVAIPIDNLENTTEIIVKNLFEYVKDIDGLTITGTIKEYSQIDQVVNDDKYLVKKFQSEGFLISNSFFIQSKESMNQEAEQENLNEIQENIVKSDGEKNFDSAAGKANGNSFSISINIFMISDKDRVSIVKVDASENCNQNVQEKNNNSNSCLEEEYCPIIKNSTNTNLTCSTNKNNGERSEGTPVAGVLCLTSSFIKNSTESHANNPIVISGILGPEQENKSTEKTGFDGITIRGVYHRLPQIKENVRNSENIFSLNIGGQGILVITSMNPNFNESNITTEVTNNNKENIHESELSETEIRQILEEYVIVECLKGKSEEIFSEKSNELESSKEQSNENVELKSNGASEKSIEKDESSKGSNISNENSLTKEPKITSGSDNQQDVIKTQIATLDNIYNYIPPSTSKEYEIKQHKCPVNEVANSAVNVLQKAINDIQEIRSTTEASCCNKEQLQQKLSEVINAIGDFNSLAKEDHNIRCECEAMIANDTLFEMTQHLASADYLAPEEAQARPDFSEFVSHQSTQTMQEADVSEKETETQETPELSQENAENLSEPVGQVKEDDKNVANKIFCCNNDCNADKSEIFVEYGVIFKQPKNTASSLKSISIKTSKGSNADKQSTEKLTVEFLMKNENPNEVESSSGYLLVKKIISQPHMSKIKSSSPEKSTSLPDIRDANVIRLPVVDPPVIKLTANDKDQDVGNNEIIKTCHSLIVANAEQRSAGFEFVSLLLTELLNRVIEGDSVAAQCMQSLIADIAEENSIASDKKSLAEGDNSSLKLEQDIYIHTLIQELFNSLSVTASEKNILSNENITKKRPSGKSLKKVLLINKTLIFTKIYENGFMEISMNSENENPEENESVPPRENSFTFKQDHDSLPEPYLEQHFWETNVKVQTDFTLGEKINSASLNSVNMVSVPDISQPQSTSDKCEVCVNEGATIDFDKIIIPPSYQIELTLTKKTERKRPQRNPFYDKIEILPKPKEVVDANGKPLDPEHPCYPNSNYEVVLTSSSEESDDEFIPRAAASAIDEQGKKKKKKEDYYSVPIVIKPLKKPKPPKTPPCRGPGGLVCDQSDDNNNLVEPYTKGLTKLYPEDQCNGVEIPWRDIVLTRNVNFWPEEKNARARVSRKPQQQSCMPEKPLCLCTDEQKLSTKTSCNDVPPKRCEKNVGLKIIVPNECGEENNLNLMFGNKQIKLGEKITATTDFPYEIETKKNVSCKSSSYTVYIKPSTECPYPSVELPVNEPRFEKNDVCGRKVCQASGSKSETSSFVNCLLKTKSDSHAGCKRKEKRSVNISEKSSRNSSCASQKPLEVNSTKSAPEILSSSNFKATVAIKRAGQEDVVITPEIKVDEDGKMLLRIPVGKTDGGVPNKIFVNIKSQKKKDGIPTGQKASVKVITKRSTKEISKDGQISSKSSGLCVCGLDTSKPKLNKSNQMVKVLNKCNQEMKPLKKALEDLESKLQTLDMTSLCREFTSEYSGTGASFSALDYPPFPAQNAYAPLHPAASPSRQIENPCPFINAVHTISKTLINDTPTYCPFIQSIRTINSRTDLRAPSERNSINYESHCPFVNTAHALSRTLLQNTSTQCPFVESVRNMNSRNSPNPLSQTQYGNSQMPQQRIPLNEDFYFKRDHFQSQRHNESCPFKNLAMPKDNNSFCKNNQQLRYSAQNRYDFDSHALGNDNNYEYEQINEDDYCPFLNAFTSMYDKPTECPFIESVRRVSSKCRRDSRHNQKHYEPYSGQNTFERYSTQNQFPMKQHNYYGQNNYPQSYHRQQIPYDRINNPRREDVPIPKIAEAIRRRKYFNTIMCPKFNQYTPMNFRSNVSSSFSREGCSANRQKNCSSFAANSYRDNYQTRSRDYDQSLFSATCPHSGQNNMNQTKFSGRNVGLSSTIKVKFPNNNH